MTEYTLGDLIVINFTKNYHYNQVMGIYKSYDADLNEVTIYPLNKEGLELVKYDKDEEQRGLHRTLPYVISNFSSAKTFLIENPYVSLDSSQKYYYDQIISRI